MVTAMTLKCSHCGAPLQVPPDQKLVTCNYCHTVTRVASTRHHPRVKNPRPHGARSAWIAGLAMTGVVGIGAIAAFVRSGPQTVTQPSSSQPEVVTVPVPSIEVQSEPRNDGVEPTTEPDVPVTPPEPATTPARPSRPKAEPTGPISTKKEAEEILRPEVLACMKEHGVHYLITRVGNNKRGGTVPPLGLTGVSVVDYKSIPGFAKTPLGQCIARAASAVRAPAYGGNYIYFGLRNDSIADPLADAPARLDTAAAKRALAALDDEARDCSTRSPAGSRPGESVRVMVYFEGATGGVSKVEPYYVDSKSAYGRCLSAVYRKARVDKFRQIEDHVVYALEP